VSAKSNVPKRGSVDAYLSSVHAEADRLAERERERDLMTVLVEVAQLRSAARAWHRRRALTSARRRSCRASIARFVGFADD
jgi:hypothetical protein